MFQTTCQDLRRRCTDRLAYLLRLLKASRVSPYPLFETLQWPFRRAQPSRRNYSKLEPFPPNWQDSQSAADETVIHLAFCGDIMFRKGTSAPILDPDLVALLDQSEFVLANCEAPVSPDDGNPPARNGPFQFQMPARYLAELVGQTRKTHWYLSTANNHAFDQGQAGLQSTIETLSQMHRVSPIGSFDESVPTPFPIHVCDGVRIGLCAWTHWMNRNTFPKSAAAPVSQGVRRDWRHVTGASKPDILIGYPHWEYEYCYFPRTATRSLASELIGSGFDLIVGNHPHVIQGIEQIGRGLCFYSLGNFVGGGTCPLGAVLGVTIATNGARRGSIVGFALHPIFRDAERNTIVLVKNSTMAQQDYCRTIVELVFASSGGKNSC